MYTKKEKTNPDIKPQRLRVTYTPSDGLRKSGCSYIKCLIEVSEAMKLTLKFGACKQATQEMIVDDKAKWKLLDKKDFVVSLTKRKYLCLEEEIDQKKFKLTDLGTKCSMEKDIKLARYDAHFVFEVHTPIRDKEIEQIPH